MNSNFTRIAEEFDNTLSRNGKEPNQMEANINLNNFRLINVGEGIDPSDAVTVKQLSEATFGGGILPPIIIDPGSGVANGEQIIPSPGAVGTRGGRTIYGMGGTGAISGVVNGSWNVGVGSNDAYRVQVQRRDGSFAQPLSIDPATTVVSFLASPTVLGNQLVSTTMANVGPYEDADLVLEGTYKPRVTTPGANDELIDSGLGHHYIVRQHRASRINGKVTKLNGGTAAGPVIAMDGCVAYVGGTNLDAVAELRSDILIYDRASPNHTNANMVSAQTRGYIDTDGRVLNGYMNVFGGADYVIGTPRANYFNLCGREIDFGTSNNNAVMGGRNGLALVSMGSAKAPFGADMFINCAAGPQLVGDPNNPLQEPNKSGARVGIQFSNNYMLDPATGTGWNRFAQPITTDGTLWYNLGTWTVKHGLDWGNTTFTGSILRAPGVEIQSERMILNALNYGLEIGSPSSLNTPYLDFHSSGGPNDFDTRIYAEGGQANVNGQGALVLDGRAFKMPSFVGFGKAPVGPTTLPANATDQASAYALINAIKSTLLNNGLAM